MKARYSVIVVILIFVAGSTEAQTQLDAPAIDKAVISNLSAQFGINSKVVTHLDLTQPFHTKARWSFVAAKQPDGSGEREGAVSFCFVENDEPDCSEGMFPAKYREEKIRFDSAPGPFYELFASDVRC